MYSALEGARATWPLLRGNDSHSRPSFRRTLKKGWTFFGQVVL